MSETVSDCVWHVDPSLPPDEAVVHAFHLMTSYEKEQGQDVGGIHVVHRTKTCLASATFPLGRDIHPLMPVVVATCEDGRVEFVGWRFQFEAQSGGGSRWFSREELAGIKSLYFWCKSHQKPWVKQRHLDWKSL